MPAIMFLDEARIKVASGNGGRGSVSFRREKFAPFGGPDGGNGGKGGDVILVADSSLNTLYHLKFRRHFAAGHGDAGRGKDCSGKAGEDLVIRLPPGTVARDVASGELIVELANGVERWTVLQGGRGGRGNARFKSSTHQTPREYEPGGEGAHLELALTLKLIADVGLLGMPNAGKSSLLRSVSNARPEVADYPFTTLTPHLGVHAFPPNTQIVFADIPGLIEGASEGKGLGTRFLRHIERTRLLLHLVEPYDPGGLSVPERVRLVRHELQSYGPELSGKTELLVLTKMDLGPKQEEISAWEKEIGAEFLRVSAVSGAGLPEMLKTVQHALADLEPARLETP